MGIISFIEEKISVIAERPFVTKRGFDLAAIEIALKKSMEAGRRNILGKTVVPHLLTIVLSESSFADNNQFLEKLSETLSRNVCEWLKEKGYETIEAMFLGFEASSTVSKQFEISVSFRHKALPVSDHDDGCHMGSLINDLSGEKYMIAGERMLIGRGIDCEVRIDDSAVSEHHACIYFQHGKLIVKDLGSTNGTRVNRERIQEKVLTDGDRIIVGTTVLTYSPRRS
jgi:hypothetical protein